MTYVTLRPWVYWNPREGSFGWDARVQCFSPREGQFIEGVFTGYREKTNHETGEVFSTIGIRAVDGSRYSCSKNRAIKLFRESAIAIGTSVRLTYNGSVERSDGKGFYHDFALAIATPTPGGSP